MTLEVKLWAAAALLIGGLALFVGDLARFAAVFGAGFCVGAGFCAGQLRRRPG